MTEYGTDRDPGVQALLDKQAISEIIYRYCRGLDRMDAALTLSCWHEDGTDDHGAMFSGTAREFIEWLWPVHAAMERTQHTIHNILIEVDGDTAGAESYYVVYLRTNTAEGVVDIVSGGRYCDQLERRGSIWKIRHRQSVSDWAQVVPVGRLDLLLGAIPLNNPDNRTLMGMRDSSDYSYRVLKRVYGQPAR
jgi:hypothetical protein